MISDTSFLANVVTLIHMLMKTNKNRRLIGFFACLFSLIYANAQNVTIGGLKYYLYPETHTAAINNGNTWTGELDIPSEIEYNGYIYTVNAMVFDAFEDCKDLTKVRIPQTIEQIIHHVLSDEPSIGGAVSPEYNNPFEGCTSLEIVFVDEDNSSFKSVDGVLFNKDGTELYCFPAGRTSESYIIPEGVASLGGDAFKNNINLVSVKLSETISRLCNGVFLGCSSLKTIDIPENVTQIGSFVFYGCNLSALIIRGILNDNSMNEELFYGMNESTKIYVPSTELNRYKGKFNRTFYPLEEYIDGIEQIKLHQLSISIFDLSGRRVSEAAMNKGLYIRNGKKIVRK